MLNGSKYPEGETSSVVELQNTLAAGYSRQNPKFSRLLWLSNGLQTPEERQEVSLFSLRNDPALQSGDDLLYTSL